MGYGESARHSMEYMDTHFRHGAGVHPRREMDAVRRSTAKVPGTPHVCDFSKAAGEGYNGALEAH